MCRYYWTQFRSKCHRIVKSDAFDIGIMVLILINTLVMASEYYPMEDAHKEFNDITNAIFNVIYLFEMVVKLLGLGFKRYVSEKFNIFDAVLVIIGMSELIFSDGSSALLVLRAFRLLRIFKLARKWKSLRNLLKTIYKSFSAISYLGLLCLLQIFIYALIGVQFFADNLHDDELDGSPRANFDNLFMSTITVF